MSILEVSPWYPCHFWDFPTGEVVQLLAPACRSQGLPRKYSRGLLRLHVPWRNQLVLGKFSEALGFLGSLLSENHYLGIING